MGYKHRAPYSWYGLLWQCKSHVRQKSASWKWNAKKLSFSYLVIHRKSTFGFPLIKDGLNRNISIRTWEGVSETCRGCSEQKHTIFQPNVLQKGNLRLPRHLKQLGTSADKPRCWIHPPPTLPNEGKLSCSHNYSIRWGTKVYISVFYEVSLGSCLWMCFLRKLRCNFLKRFLATTLIHFIFFWPIFQLNRKPLLSVKHNSRVTEAETMINI